MLPTLVFAANAWAETAEKVEQVAPLGGNQTAVDTSALVRMTLALLFVLALVVGLSWLMKRSGLKGYANQGKMQVKASLALGTKEKVVWVKAGNKEVLLGVGQGKVNYLCDVDPQEDESVEQAPPTPFAKQLEKILGKTKEEPVDE